MYAMFKQYKSVNQKKIIYAHFSNKTCIVIKFQTTYMPVTGQEFDSWYPYY